MREFATAVEQQTKTPDEVQKGDTFDIVRQAKDPETGEVVEIERKTIRYYRPSDGQFAVLMAGTGRHSSDAESIGTVLNFFESVLDESGAKYIGNRLLDRDDEFGLAEVTEIMEEMIAEWGGRPTKRSSVSSQSAKTDGQNLTPTTLEPTSSTSLLTGS